MKINWAVIQSNDAGNINEDTELSSVWECNEWNPLSPKTKRFSTQPLLAICFYCSFLKVNLSALPLPWSLNSTHVDGDREPKGNMSLSACPPSIYTSPFSFVQRMGPLQMSHWQVQTIHHSIRAPVWGMCSRPVRSPAKSWVGKTSATTSPSHWH